MNDIEIPVVDPFGRERRARIRQRLGMLGLLGALVATLGIAVAVSGGDGESADDDPDAPDAELIDPAGPTDGLDSIGLPVAAEPDMGLADGQTVTVSGKGFTPLAQVGMAQCWDDEGPGGQDKCDIAVSAITTADANGEVVMSLTVHRFINTASGTKDCALGNLTESCVIGMGNLADYDESGNVRLFFDAELAGDVPPRIEVSPTSGLVDDQELTVVGTGFVPGETVHLGQCMPGGLNGGGGCYGDNPAGNVTADAEGNFTTTVVAQRLVRGGGVDLDCYVGPYPCVMVAGAERIPNSVQLTYDGGTGVPDGFEWTLVPNDGLIDEQVVQLEMFGLRGVGGVTVRQCADQGPLGETCELLGEVEVFDRRLSTSLVVSRILTQEIDVVDEQDLVTTEIREVDCADAGRTCYLRIDRQGISERLPIHFAPEG